MANEILTNWSSDKLEAIKSLPINNLTHKNNSNESYQVGKAIKGLMKDAQVKKAIELLAAE